jgi:hypothetical protein
MGCFVLVHEGKLFVGLPCRAYRLSEAATAVAVFDGREVVMERAVSPASVPYSYWFTCAGDDAPDRIEVRSPTITRTIGYRLADERVSGTMPATLTVDEYNAAWDEDNPKYDPVVSRVYEAVREPFTPEPTVIDGWTRLDGEPWPETDLHWVVRLPHELSGQAMYGHLFPGHIAGSFKEHLAELLQARDDVQYCFDRADGLELTVRSGQVSRKLLLRPPYRIEAPNFRRALELWAAGIEAAEDAVAAISGAVCPACNGSGTTVPAPKQAKRGRRR